MQVREVEDRMTEYQLSNLRMRILADYIVKNSKLRKKLEDKVGEYVKQLEILAKLRPADPPAYPCPSYGGNINPGAPATNPGYWNAMMSQRMDDLEKKI
ncbi:hypothetical protein NL676_033711 [Syzygium grande]|nr:hypothetical protein NL676_033711 [Syzygium grande]